MCSKGNLALHFCCPLWWFFFKSKLCGKPQWNLSSLKLSIISTSNGQKGGMSEEGKGWEGWGSSEVGCGLWGELSRLHRDEGSQESWSKQSLKPQVHLRATNALLHPGARAVTGVSGWAFYNWVTWAVFLEWPFIKLREVTERSRTPIYKTKIRSFNFVALSED